MSRRRKLLSRLSSGRLDQKTREKGAGDEGAHEGTKQSRRPELSQSKMVSQSGDNACYVGGEEARRPEPGGVERPATLWDLGPKCSGQRSLSCLREEQSLARRV